ncbi:MAG: ATP-binding protein [Kofleriaceae bacterium]|nr:ATP-binding protein [Kofleriaceae bacterium]
MDWAFVGKLPFPGGERQLWLFVMVLARSRARCGASSSSTSRSTRCAARWCAPRRRSAASRGSGCSTTPRPSSSSGSAPRCGSTRRCALCAAMRVEPRLCAVARPEHKGKVERAIRYLRDRFLAGRTITSVDDGNRALARFIADIGHARPHPRLAPRTVADVVAAERPRLLSLPDPLPATAHVEPAAVDSQAFVRFDTNRYSVPTALAERALTLVTDDRFVRVLDGTACVATHPRSWGKRQQIELPEHRDAPVVERKAARDLKGRDRLRAVAPEIDRLVERWAVTGPSLGLRVTRTIAARPLRRRRVHRRRRRRGGPRPRRCRRARDGLREAPQDRRRPVPVELVLPDHLDDADVVPHALRPTMSDADDDLGERLRRLGFRVGRGRARRVPRPRSQEPPRTHGDARAARRPGRARSRGRQPRTAHALRLHRRLQAARPFRLEPPEKIDRALVDRLVELDFVDRGENVLLKGGSGLGKTTIAQHLGITALAAGYTVRFSTLAAALADLLGQESVPAFDRRIRRYTRPDLLILDELGYLPCDSRAADILYAIISRRHERASTIITTNLAFKRWAPSSLAPPASSPSSTASRSTVTASRSSAPPGATSTAWTPDDRPTPRPDRPRRKRP